MNKNKDFLNILIIDDEESIRLILKRILRSAPVNIFEANNGKEALLILFKHMIDLAIVDLNMKVMNGLTFIREAKRTRPSLHIMVVSGYIDASALQMLRELEIKHIFKKPIEIAKLKQHIDTILQLVKSQKTLQEYTNYLENFAAISNIAGYLIKKSISIRPIREIWQDIMVLLLDVLKASRIVIFVKEETSNFLFFHSTLNDISQKMLKKIEEAVLLYFKELGGNIDHKTSIEYIGILNNNAHNDTSFFDCKVPIIRNDDIKGALMLDFIDSRYSQIQGLFLYHIASQISLLLELASSSHTFLTKDQLTGLFTKNYFLEQLQYIQQMAIREGFPLALAFVDIDKFKELNDTYGHKYGDQVLKEVADILSNTTRKEDIVARLGGDEFAIILPGCTREGYLVFASRLFDTVRNKFFIPHDLNIHLTISIGIAGFSAIELHHRTPNDILDAVDKTMYQAKKNGGNTIAIYSTNGIELINDVSSIDLSAKYTEIAFKNDPKEIEDFLLSLMALRMDVFGYHSIRTGKIIEIFGNNLEIKGQELKTLFLAALFHDIGKIAIPGRILNKPGVLSNDEYVIVRKHSEIGYHILSTFKPMNYIADIVLQHHERFDGKGYPNKLKGEEILYHARMISIADVYDVMRTKRPYTNILSSDKAVEELQKHSNTQFDPKLVEQFVKCIPQIEQEIYSKDERAI